MTCFGILEAMPAVRSAVVPWIRLISEPWLQSLWWSSVWQQLEKVNFVAMVVARCPAFVSVLSVSEAKRKFVVLVCFGDLQFWGDSFFQGAMTVL